MEIKNWTINDDYTIDVNKYVNLNGQNLYNFPSFIQFGHIKSTFLLIDNFMTSLKGCPYYVEGSFDCSGNELKTLEGAPIKVKGDFYCHSNPGNFAKEYVMTISRVGGYIFV